MMRLLLDWFDWLRPGFGGGGGGGAGQRQLDLQQQEEARKAARRKEVGSLFEDPAAMSRFAGEESDLSKALRDFYSSDLRDKYQEAERQNRFGAARRGLLGGSEYATSVANLSQENQLGGTRIEEAVNRAINALRNQREQSKQQAYSLIDTGSGEAGVRAAQAGIDAAAANAKSAEREQILNDLFSNLAFAREGVAGNQRNLAALNYYNRARGALTPSGASFAAPRVQT